MNRLWLTALVVVMELLFTMTILVLAVLVADAAK
jgi:hypothetical protein